MLLCALEQITKTSCQLSHLLLQQIKDILVVLVETTVLVQETGFHVFAGGQLDITFVSLTKLPTRKQSGEAHDV